VAAAWIVSRAAAADRREKKNEAKMYFKKGCPSKDAVQLCEAGSCEQVAIERLGGKRALYADCAAQLRALPARSVANDYLRELDERERIYVEIRNRIVSDNLGLVESTRRRFNLHVLPPEDLRQIGAIALQKAVENYDLTTGTRFSTYAVTVIHGELVRAGENASKIIRVPSHKWVEMRAYAKTYYELEQLYGRQPTPEEIAEDTGKPLGWAQEIAALYETPESIHRPLGEDLTLEDTLVDSNAYTPWTESSWYECVFEENQHRMDLLEREVIRQLLAGLKTGIHEVDQIARNLGVCEETCKNAIASAGRKIAHRAEFAA
jgi:RNA polymerase primary sigma factor